MAKPYAKLRALMLENDIFQVDLCEELDRSNYYITSRIMGHEPWTQDEIYKLLDMFNIPYEEMHIVFPPRGKKVS